MIKLRQAVIVEGKYDKIRLENFLDAVILTTDGFHLFKDREKRDLIRLFAQKSGIIVMTDSDHAGQMIRTYIADFVKQGEIVNVYLPAIRGKEKRKAKTGAEGLIGVEGIGDDIIKQALFRAGVTGEAVRRDEKKLTKTDFYNLGLSGRQGSEDNRRRLCRRLGFPDLPANSLLAAVNSLYGYDAFLDEVETWKREETEN